MSELLWSKVADRRDEFSSLCGVPYNALPLATVSVVCECVCVSVSVCVCVCVCCV